MTSRTNVPMISRAWLLAGIAALALAGCGGGGGGGEPTGTAGPAAVQILDSFGQEVSAGGADGVGVGDSGADGTAGEGAAIVGGVVLVTDSTGKTVTGNTDAQGYYRVKVTGFTPPFVAKVTKPDGKVFHSLNIKALKVNGFITLNITGLTDKVASDVARAGGKTRAADLTPQIVSANPGAIAESLKQLRSQIGAVITAAGIADVNSFDPLSAPFRPDRTGYDKVLDNVVVTVGADGQTQVTVSPTFTPPGGLTGNWSLSVAVAFDMAGVPAIAPTTVDVPGSGVPKDAAAASNYCENGTSQVVQASGVNATVTCSGNTFTVVIPGDGTVTTVFNFVSYQGCGSCGVGSQVIARSNAVVTAVLTDGSSTSYNYSVTNTYTRKN